jgi:hypothetical protein
MDSARSDQAEPPTVLRRGATSGSIVGMKLSVSVPSEDIAFLDSYANEHALGSRSAALHQAIKALRMSALPGSYAEAWSDWNGDGDAEAWETTIGDGAT